MDDETGGMLEYHQLVKIPKHCKKWSKAFGKEIGRLVQGLDGIAEGTNTIFSSCMTKSQRIAGKILHMQESVLMSILKKLIQIAAASHWVAI